MSDKEKQQEELRLFKHYLQELKEIKKDLEKIKKISDSSQKYNKVSAALEKCLYKQAGAIGHYNSGKLYELNAIYLNDLRENDKLVKELRKLKAETKEKASKKELSNDISKPKQRTVRQAEEENRGAKQEYISCQQCFKEIKLEAEYYYHNTKNDDYKFCSEECYTEFYGEICNQCLKKTLDFHQDKEYSEIVYCSECYDKREQEEIKKLERELTEIEKQQEVKEENELTIYCRYCKTECPSIFDVCEKEVCLNKLYAEQENLSREDKNLDHKRQQNNAFSSKQRERERESQFSSQSSNYLPWILGSIGILGLISLVLYLVFRKKSKGT